MRNAWSQTRAAASIAASTVGPGASISLASGGGSLPQPGGRQPARPASRLATRTTRTRPAVFKAYASATRAGTTASGTGVAIGNGGGRGSVAFSNLARVAGG